ncbi:MAG: ATP-binding cassette domain-containing protein [Spirochaetota bacterium]
MTQLHLSSVSYTYSGLAAPLIQDLDLVATPGWTGIVGPNGAGKSTLLALATGRLAPDTGVVSIPGAAVVCEQRTDDPPDLLAELVCVPDADAGRLVSLLGLGADWPWRWETLSHGERKRAQIAVALWSRPELLVVDEPTNHLDRQARGRLTEALLTYDGVGLIVSHDRTLLDRLCAQCLFLEVPGRAAIRPGGVTAGMDQAARERLEQERVFDRAQREQKKIEAEATRRREEAAIQNRKRSKRGLGWKDSDAREKIDRARISGADGQAGRLLNQLDGRRAQAGERLAGLERPVRERVGVSVHGIRSRSDQLLKREAGALHLPDGRAVQLPELVVRPDDRIALQGANGAGKTTLLRALLEERDDVLWIPQEITAGGAMRLVEEARALEKGKLGRVISTVSRLASSPERLLETGLPSPGETRKLMLALGLERRPPLVVMDEPTNHLDLVSMRCLEEALASFEGALLLVSHDDAFVDALARTLWVIEGGYLEVKAIR